MRLHFASMLRHATAVGIGLVLGSSVVATTVHAQRQVQYSVAERNRALLDGARNELEQRAFESRMGGRYRNGAAQSYVERIGVRLVTAWATAPEYPALDYQLAFAVLDSPHVGAYLWGEHSVYVTRGLLAAASAEDQVAAAIAHEMAHVFAGHADRRRANAERLREPAALRGFNHQLELEADALSLNVLARAGYDPAAQVRMLHALLASSSPDQVVAEAHERGMEPRESTHPTIAARVRAIERVIRPLEHRN